MLKNYAPYLLPLLLVLGLFALPYARAEWTAPLCGPTLDGPGCNVPALPLNVGSVAQEKAGDLTIAGLGTFLNGLGIVGSSFGLTDGDLNYKIVLSPDNLSEPTAGKFLTSLDEQGSATWSHMLEGGRLYTMDSNFGRCDDEGSVTVGDNNGYYLCFSGGTPR